MPYRVGQQLGNYRLVRLLGRGAFAEVSLGEHRYLKSNERNAWIQKLEAGQNPFDAKTLQALRVASHEDE